MPRDRGAELYDAACEVLAAAQRLAAAARTQGVGPAIPATLGCLGESLAELARSSEALAEEMRRTHTVPNRPATACIGALDDLTGTLRAARSASEAARSRAAVAAAFRAKAVF